MSVNSFTIGGIQYNAAIASAVDQDTLMSLLSASLIERWVTAASAGAEVGEKIVIAMFMSMPQVTKQACAKILMGKVVINGTQQQVTAADFGGRMVEYNQLLAALLEWNLGDFFVWLPSVLESEELKAAESEAK